ILYFFFSSRRRHTRFSRDWSSDVCSSDLTALVDQMQHIAVEFLGHGEDCVAVARQGGRMILAYPVLKWMVQCGWPSHEGTLHLHGIRVCQLGHQFDFTFLQVLSQFFRNLAAYGLKVGHGRRVEIGLDDLTEGRVL